MPNDLNPLDLGGGVESGISIPPIPFEGHITLDRSFAQVLAGVQEQLRAASSTNLKRPRPDSDDASESSSCKRQEYL